MVSLKKRPVLKLSGIVFAAAGWLLFSGLLLVATVLALDGTLTSGSLVAGDGFVLVAEELRTIEGRMSTEPDGSTRLTPSKRQRILVTSGPIEIDAGNHGFFQWQASEIDPEISVLLFWRRLGNRKHTVVALDWSGPRGGVLDLRKERGWKGRISEIGLAFENVSDSNTRFQSMALFPPSIEMSLRALADAWLVFTPLTQKTANFLNLGAAEMALPATLAAAVWLGVAALGYLIFGFLRGAVDLRVLAAIAVIAWLVLDARWGIEAWRQLTLTADRYAGKSWQEKNHSQRDADLVFLADRVKAELPQHPQRILILTSKSGNRSEWERERLQYHLLPHNPFAYRSAASFFDRMKPGDFILSLGEGENEKNPFLRKEEVRVRLELVYRDDLARLYRLLETGTAPRS